MQTPLSPDPALFAPCGMYCLVCSQHCRAAGACPGCRAEDARKPKHCVDCRRKLCAQRHGVAHCFACSAFPCALLKSLDKSYKRYGVSLIENGRAAARGLEAFLAQERRRWSCPACGGVISLHDGVCSVCGKERKV